MFAAYDLIQPTQRPTQLLSGELVHPVTHPRSLIAGGSSACSAQQLAHPHGTNVILHPPDFKLWPLGIKDQVLLVRRRGGISKPVAGTGWVLVGSWKKGMENWEKSYRNVCRHGAVPWRDSAWRWVSFPSLQMDGLWDWGMLFKLMKTECGQGSGTGKSDGFVLRAESVILIIRIIE